MATADVPAAGEHADTGGRPHGLPLASTVVLLTAVTTFALSPLLPVIGEQMKLSAATLGTITAALAAGRLLTDLPAGWIADQVPARWTLAAAGVLLAAGAAVIATAADLARLLVGAGLLGVASAVVNTVSMTRFSVSVPAARRGRALATFSAAVLVGQALGPGGAGWTAQASSWRAAMSGGALLGVAVVGVCLGAGGTVLAQPGPARPAAARDTRRLRRLPAAWTRRVGWSRGRPHRPRLPTPTSAPTGATPPAAAGRADRDCHPPLPRSARLALLLVPAAEFFGLGAAVFTVAPIVGAETLDLSAGAIGAVLAGGGIARLAGTQVAGRLTDRIGRKVVLIPGQLLMAAAALLMVPGQRQVAVWVAAVVLLSAATQGIAVGASMLADRTAPGSTGRHVGAYRLAGDVGLLCGPLVGGWLLEHAGVLASLTPTVLLLAASALAVRRLVPETYHPAGGTGTRP